MREMVLLVDFVSIVDENHEKYSLFSFQNNTF